MCSIVDCLDEVTWTCVHCNSSLCDNHKQEYRLADSDIQLYTLVQDMSTIQTSLIDNNCREICKKCVFPYLISIVSAE